MKPTPLSRRHRWPSLGPLVAGVAAAGFLVVLVVWPLAAVLVKSLVGADIERVVEVMTRPATRSVLGFTIAQALGSTVLTIVFGLPVAGVLAHYRFPGRSVVRVVTVVPFVLPTVVVAAAIAAGFDRIGLDGNGSLVAVLAAHVLFNLAVVVRIVGGFWAGQDRRILEAAQVLGAGRLALFRRITLPRLAPVLAAASVVVFLFSFTSFGVIRVLGGARMATVETEIHRYAVYRSEFDVAAILAMMQLSVVVGLSAASAILQRRMASTAGGRHRPLARPVDSPRSVGAVVVGLGIVAVIVVAPLVSLVERSVLVGRADKLGGLRGDTTTSYGLDHYRRLFTEGDLLPVAAIEALANSLWFGITAAVIATVVGLAASAAAAWGGRLGRGLEILSLVPLGVSAVTLGFGYLVAFAAFDLRRSVWIVPLSHAVIGIPFVMASVLPRMRSLDPRMREVAATLGAKPTMVGRLIEWPLVRTAAATGAGFSFAVSLGEFGATSFLARSRSSFTAPLAIFQLLSQPGAVLQGQAMALSVIIGLMVAVVAAIVEYRRDGTGGGTTAL